MNIESYQQSLKTASKLRLKAKSLMAESDENAFEVAVLLHDAERLILSAQQLLDADDQASKIRLVAERCWCLLDGFDPLAAMRLRDTLNNYVSDEHTSGLVRTTLSRLNPLLKHVLKEHYSLILRAKTFMDAARERRLPLKPWELSAARSEAEMLTGAYPGTASYWWVKYRVLDALGDKGQAWECLERAHKLSPESADIYRAIMVHLAPDVFSEEQARIYLSTITDTLEQQPVEVLLHYTFAELKLHKHDRTSPFLERARYATELGEARSEQSKWKGYFRVARRMIDSRISGKQLSLQILVDEGLGDLLPQETKPNLAVSAVPKDLSLGVEHVEDRRDAEQGRGGGPQEPMTQRPVDESPPKSTSQDAWLETQLASLISTVTVAELQGRIGIQSASQSLMH
jgi:hypothetical protein